MSFTPDASHLVPTCEVTVALYGITKDIVGQPEIRQGLSMPATVADLLGALRAKYPRLGELTSLAVAVNSEYAEVDWELHSNDEIALIPPVSGG